MAEKYNYERQQERLLKIGEAIAMFVSDKDAQYGSSWRKRGGVGAFMVMARKWDRIENACASEKGDKTEWNIFHCIEDDKRSESIVDDIVDHIGYYMVILEYMAELGHITSICGKDMWPQLQPGDVIHPAPRSTDGQEHPFGFTKEDDGV